MELPFAPPHFVQVHDVVGKKAVQLLIGLVDEDKDEVEPEIVVKKLLEERNSLKRVFGPGEESRVDFEIFSHSLGAVVVAADGVGGGEDGCPGRQRVHDSRLGDGHSLLLHGLEERVVLRGHLVKLVDAADPLREICSCFFAGWFNWTPLYQPGQQARGRQPP